MISVKELYSTILTPLTPMYVALILGYCSVKWWKVFTPEQCSGISHFCAIFAVPYLSFHYMSTLKFQSINLQFFAADGLQKTLVLVVLAFWSRISSKASLEMSITLFSITVLPNTLVMGTHLVRGMYGPSAVDLVVQIVVLQSVVWHTLLLFLYEYNRARIIILQQFSKARGSIISSRVDQDVELTHKSSLEGGNLGLDVEGGIPPLEGVNAKTKDNGGDGGGEDSKMCSSCNSSSRDIAEMQELREGVDSEIPPNQTPPPNCTTTSTSAVAATTDVVTAPFNTNPAATAPTIVIPLAIKLTVIMVWKKIIWDPYTYSTICGLALSLLSFRFHFDMPVMVDGLTEFLSNSSLGMGMFNVGLSMALQTDFKACGKGLVASSMMLRFFIGPGIMAAACKVVGMHGASLRVAIIQAALPHGLLPYVFAKKYNVHHEFLGVGVTFGYLVALPIILVYCFLLGL